MKKACLVLALGLLIGCGEGSETRPTQSNELVFNNDVATTVVEVDFPVGDEYTREEVNSSETRTVWKRKTFGEFSVQKTEYCYFNTVNPRFSPAMNVSSEDGIETCNWDFLIQNDSQKWTVEQNITAYEAGMNINFVDVTGDGKKEFEIVDMSPGDGVGSMTRYFQLNKGKWEKLFFANSNIANIPISEDDLIDYIPNDLGEDGGPPSIEDGLLGSYGQGPCSPVSDSYEFFFRWNGKFFEISHWNYDGQMMKPSKTPKCPPGFILK